MELNRSIYFTVNDWSCELRNLHPVDVSSEYIDGLKRQNKYLMNVPQDVSLESQKNYIKKILFSKENSICGIFINGGLVGTSGVQFSGNVSKYIDASTEKIATMGIFLFDQQIRGTGFGKTLVWASTYLLHYCTGMEWFGAGMEKENIPSLKSFLSCGFKRANADNEGVKVFLNYTDLIKPEIISSISIREIDQKEQN